MEGQDKNYIFLADENENQCEGELQLIQDLNSSHMSRTSTIISSVKTISEYSYVAKIFVYIVFCNPFIKLITNTFYKRISQLSDNENENIENILNQKEKKIISYTIVSLLMVFNLIIMIMINEYHLKAGILFVNNIYLFYFAFNLYNEEFKFNTDKGKIKPISWEILMSQFDHK
jgi:hypothetical protein